jgi:hypothetical protein
MFLLIGKGYNNQPENKRGTAREGGCMCERVLEAKARDRRM